MTKSRYYFHDSSKSNWILFPEQKKRRKNNEMPYLIANMNSFSFYSVSMKLNDASVINRTMILKSKVFYDTWAHKKTSFNLFSFRINFFLFLLFSHQRFNRSIQFHCVNIVNLIGMEIESDKTEILFFRFLGSNLLGCVVECVVCI